MNDEINVCFQNHSMYVRVAYKYLKSLEDAEDCVQEAFLKVLKNKHTYNSTGSVEGWVKRIVINTAIDRYRRKTSAKVVYDTEKVNSFKGSEEVETPYGEGIPHKMVLEAIQSLSGSYKRAITLYLIEGYNHREIAGMLNISEGTSKSNLSKAKKNVINYIYTKQKK
jgi:RNA polymerase sigma factor (sigma-70 family)